MLVDAYACHFSIFVCMCVFSPNKATLTITVHSFHPRKLKCVVTRCYMNLHQAKLVWLTVNTAYCAVVWAASVSHAELRKTCLGSRWRREDVEENHSDCEFAAVHAGMDLRRLHSRYGSLEVSSEDSTTHYNVCDSPVSLIATNEYFCPNE